MDNPLFHFLMRDICGQNALDALPTFLPLLSPEGVTRQEAIFCASKKSDMIIIPARCHLVKYIDFCSLL